MKLISTIEENGEIKQIIYRQQIYKLQQGAGQPHVYALDINKFAIPVPSQIIQNEILSHIKAFLRKCNNLQKEATFVFENAKQEIKKMILG